MPKTQKKTQKTKKLTYKQMMNDILKPKPQTTNRTTETENKTPSGLGGGTFEKVQRI